MNTQGSALGAPSMGQSAKRGIAILALLSVIFTMLTSISIFGSTQTAQAAPICTPGNIYVNTGGTVNQLNQYTPTGELASSVPTARSYTDIAFSANGLTLYGIFPDVPPVLYTIDPDTGVETASVPVTGLPAEDYFVNALSALADGTLLVGASPSAGVVGQQIFRIDPTTGAATLYPASFPAGFGSAGDFLTLADGDILAVAEGTSGDAFFRIKADFSLVQVGTIPESFGAAQSGGQIYLAGATGDLYEIATVPTAASTAPVATTTIATTGLPFYGATSQQDSGRCSELTVVKSSDPASGTAVALGQTITYTIELANLNGTAPAEVDLEDNLSGVLDDAVITNAPVVSSGGALTVGPLTNNSFLVSGILPVGGQSTITYSVTINDPATGDHRLTNYVIPTGTAPPTTCESTDLACTTHPISDLSLVKSVGGTEVTAVGQQLTYSFVVTNTGGTTLTGVTVVEGEFNGSGVLGAITPASVASLAPGVSTTFTAAYTATQADLNSGKLSNTATATGVPPTGPQVKSQPSSVEIASARTASARTASARTASALAATGSEPWWAALLAGAFLIVVGGAFKVRSGSRFARP